MEKRPLFAFGLALFAGAFSAGLRPWYLTYIVLACFPAFAIAYTVWHIRSGEAQIFTLVLVSLAFAALPTISYVNCTNVWKSRMAGYREYDGKTVEARLRLASPIERSENYIRIEAEPLILAESGLASRSSANAESGSASGPTGYSGQAPDFMLLDSFGSTSASRPPRNNGKILLSFKNESADGIAPCLRYGNVIEVIGKLAKPVPQQNEFIFDYETYLYSKGIAAVIYADESNFKIVSTPKHIFGIPVNPIGTGIALRSRVEQIFSQSMPPREAALMTAILTGNSDAVSDRARKDFIAAGLLHMTAVSGLHIMIVSNLVAAAAKKAGLGVRAARLVTLAVITVFVFAAGFSPSVVRAGLAFGLASLARFAAKPYDQLSALGAAMILLILSNPMQAFGAGFLLSFSAALSIYLFSNHLNAAAGADKLPGAISGTLFIGAAVGIGCYPVQASLFNQFSTISMLTNLVCAPLIIAVVASGIVTAAAGLFFFALTPAPAYIAVTFLWAIESIAALAARIPGALLRPGAFGALQLVIYYSALAAVIYLIAKYKKAAGRRAKIKIAAAAIAAAFIAAPLIYAAARIAGPGPDEMELVFLDVGNSNAAYVNVGGRYHAVVDAGGPLSYTGKSAQKETRLCEYLLGRGVGAIDVAVLTHGDSDHIQGFWSILEDIPVRKLLLPYYRDAFTEELASYASEKGAEVYWAAAGDSVSLSRNAVIEVISPFAQTSGGGLDQGLPPSNDTSLVTRFAIGGAGALFCGDIGKGAETGLVSRAGAPLLSASLMSVPHHGSKYSSSAEFLEAVSPEAAVAGVGKNSYGHPAPETVERYASAGARFYRTDTDGMVTAVVGKNGIKYVKRFNGADNLYAWQRSAAE